SRWPGSWLPSVLLGSALILPKLGAARTYHSRAYDSTGARPAAKVGFPRFHIALSPWPDLIRPSTRSFRLFAAPESSLGDRWVRYKRQRETRGGQALYRRRFRHDEHRGGDRPARSGGACGHISRRPRHRRHLSLGTAVREGAVGCRTRP